MFGLSCLKYVASSFKSLSSIRHISPEKAFCPLFTPQLYLSSLYELSDPLPHKFVLFSFKRTKAYLIPKTVPGACICSTGLLCGWSLIILPHCFISFYLFSSFFYLFSTCFICLISFCHQFFYLCFTSFYLCFTSFYLFTCCCHPYTGDHGPPLDRRTLASLYSGGSLAETSLTASKAGQYGIFGLLTGNLNLAKKLCEKQAKFEL